MRREIKLNIAVVVATIGWLAMVDGLTMLSAWLPDENKEAMQESNYFEVPVKQQIEIAREHVSLSVAVKNLRQRHPALYFYPPAVGTASEPTVYVMENEKLIESGSSAGLSEEQVDALTVRLNQDKQAIAQEKTIESEAQTEHRIQRLSWALTLRSVLFIAGLGTILYWWKRSPQCVFPEEAEVDTRTQLWTWRTTYGVVLAVLYLVSLTVFAVTLLPPEFVRGQTYATFDTMSGILLAVLSWSILYGVSRIKKVPLNVVAYLRVPETGEQWRNVLQLGLGGFLVTYVIETFIECAYVAVTGQVPDSTNPVTMSLAESARSHNVTYLLMYLFAIGITAPITEEPLFRGFLYTALRGFWGVAPAALVSGFVFAVVHGDLPGLWELWAFGAMAALFLHRSGTLLVPMIIHGLANSFEMLEAVILWWN
jgi:membrane protease YdiL (CAAX protease family)